LRYYFICGIGAGICDIVFNALWGNMNTRTIGASGAIFGLLLAYGLLYPDRTIFMNFLFPIKVKYFVMIMGAIAFLSSLRAPSASATLLTWRHALRLCLLAHGVLEHRHRTMRKRFQQWRLQRAKKKFQVYMRKQQSDRDRWVN